MVQATGFLPDTDKDSLETLVPHLLQFNRNRIFQSPPVKRRCFNGLWHTADAL